MAISIAGDTFPSGDRVLVSSRPLAASLRLRWYSTPPRPTYRPHAYRFRSAMISAAFCPSLDLHVLTCAISHMSDVSTVAKDCALSVSRLVGAPRRRQTSLWQLCSARISPHSYVLHCPSQTSRSRRHSPLHHIRTLHPCSHAHLLHSSLRQQQLRKATCFLRRPIVFLITRRLLGG
jgi:hypothetical protein